MEGWRILQECSPGGVVITNLESTFAKSGASVSNPHLRRARPHPGSNLGETSPLAFDNLNWGRQQPTQRQAHSRVPRLFGTRTARTVACSVDQCASPCAAF